MHRSIEVKPVEAEQTAEAQLAFKIQAQPEFATEGKRVTGASLCVTLQQLVVAARLQ